MSLAERILKGEIRAAARLMRDLDDGYGSAVDELKVLYPHAGKAFILGVTGPPGVGKSTLIDQIIAVYRGMGQKVGIVAVDPTSPFTGGAILGDRIRMNRHDNDEHVFIRSLATRGQLGGVSRSTADVVTVMDAMGMDVVIIETVGVGQDEIDIVRIAHTTVVVMAPGFGDDIQAIKAGILEIGDVFVVNKADSDEAQHTAHDLETMLHMNRRKDTAPHPKVLLTEAAHNRGIAELVEAIEAHRVHVFDASRIERFAEERSAQQLMRVLKERLFAEVCGRIQGNGTFGEIVNAMVARTKDPYTAVEEILAENLKRPTGSLSNVKDRRQS